MQDYDQFMMKIGCGSCLAILVGCLAFWAAFLWITIQILDLIR